MLQKKQCKCNIRGIAQLYTDKKGLYYKTDPRDYGRSLRRFRFCPLCGKKLQEL